MDEGNWPNKLNKLARTLPDAPFELTEGARSQKAMLEASDEIAAQGRDIDPFTFLKYCGKMFRAMYESPIEELDFRDPGCFDLYNDLIHKTDGIGKLYGDATFLCLGVMAFLLASRDPAIQENWQTLPMMRFASTLASLKDPSVRNSMDSQMEGKNIELKMIHLYAAFVTFSFSRFPVPSTFGGEAVVRAVGEDPEDLIKAMTRADRNRARSWSPLTRFYYFKGDYRQAYKTSLRTAQLAKDQGMALLACTMYNQALNSLKFGAKGDGYFLSDVLPIVEQMAPLLNRCKPWTPHFLWKNLKEGCEDFNGDIELIRQEGIAPQQRYFPNSPLPDQAFGTSEAPGIMLAVPRCVVCGKMELALKKCTGCKDDMVLYCSKECQLADWKQHKKVCKRLDKKA